MTFNLWKLDDHPELVSALFAAHREAAIANDNASKLCVLQAWGGSGRFENAIIAGMATIGALHAPLVAARELWEAYHSWDEDFLRYSFDAVRVPGVGNSFHQHDGAFNGVLGVLAASYQEEFNRIARLEYHASGAINTRSGTLAVWRINAAMYTAIVASICEVPRGLEPALFALARIPAWAEMCGAVQHPKVGGVR